MIILRLHYMHTSPPRGPLRRRRNANGNNARSPKTDRGEVTQVSAVRVEERRAAGEAGPGESADSRHAGEPPGGPDPFPGPGEWNAAAK